MTRHLRPFSIGEGSGFRDAAQSCIVPQAARRRHSGEKAMRFGWLTLSLSPSPEEDAARIDQQIAQIRAAEQLGFSDVWLTEHYFTGESVYNDALLFAAAVAMRTERIRIGFAVVQLPFHHPVQLAVRLALLDNLSKGRIDVGVGKGTVYNEYEFVGHGLRSDDSRARMQEAIEIIELLWQGGPVTHSGRYFQADVPELRPLPVQRPLPLWRSVISPASFEECGRLGVPILTARLPVARIRERWAAYASGLEAGGHDAATRARLLAQSALWRNVYVADSDVRAEDELSALLLRTRAHMMHVRAAYNPPGFTIDPAMLNPWADPAVGDAEALRYVLETGSLFGSPARVRDQIAELRDAGVQHLLCQTGFGDMSHEQNLASMRRFGEQVMPAFRV
jgi:alkanesulfonate monooxygenase SsuD/methylene tetrahydromethanopterin reductase-like flavin-dependent oxidoreductase (luciferase family)